MVRVGPCGLFAMILERSEANAAPRTPRQVGYGKYYRALKQQLSDEFGDELSFVPVEDPGTTGNFEVTLVETSELIHSKTQRQQGRCESAAEVQAIVDKVQSYLDAA